MKTIEINGKNFEFCGTTNRCAVKQRSLYDVYANPSETKRQIWYEWSTWFLHAGIFEYGVSSYNSNFFTINAIYYDKETKKEYLLVITAMHDKIYEIEV